MPLPDVNINILDGGLGMLPSGSAGLQAKIGVCSAGTVGQIVSVTDPGKIKDLFGTGPLCGALYDAFAAGARVVYAVKASSDIAGTIGSITATKTGQGNITASGSPLDAYEAVVVIVDSGAKNAATFKYSLDGGDNFSEKITVPTGLSYVVPDTGITLEFTEFATYPDQSFLADDKYEFKTKAPQASVNSVNNAIEVLLDSSYLYEFIHVVGESDAAMWAALDVKALEAEAKFRFIHFLAEAAAPAEGDTVDQWVADLLAAKASFASTRVSICAGQLELIDMGTGRSVTRNGAGIYSGRVSSIPVQQSPGKVMTGSLPAVIGLRPVGINDGHILALDEAGFITFRQYIGLNGFYVTNGRIAAEVISDFRFVEVRRPMDKACSLVRTAGLRYEHAEIDPLNQDKSLSAIEASLTAPLDIMAGNGEIAGGRVVIPRDQDVLATSTLRVKVRIVPMATMRWLELEIGYENPFQQS
ncbi:DUF2586 domain-containing protein [Desulfotruncus alcoholivorax]|uniref:DUF2586 domain-containing protein n=1 Tax=Desulfotruncus alcoholivorax TaxID=265477 RepID=UPI000413E9A1|nr:DUF2586 domain-containing protein [Desulfotruncus alcoholivorax]